MQARIVVIALVVLGCSLAARAETKEEATFKSSGTTGAWVAKLVENRMDARPRLIVAIEGDKPFPGSIGQKRPALIIQCEAGDVDLFVNAETVLEGSVGRDTIPFRVKLDGAKPEILHGASATSLNSIFFPSPKTFVERLRGANELLIEVTPLRYGAATASFKVTGLDQHRAAIKAHCKV